MEMYHHTKITKINGSVYDETDDLIAIEKKVRISVNGKSVLSLYCTPSMIREFVVGVIHNEGLLSGEWCAERITIEYGDEITVDVPATGSLREGEKIVTSGCGGGVSFARTGPENRITDSAVFSAAKLKNIFREFQRKSEAYKLTGGVHSAAVTDGDNILIFAEDIGRHNAVDKAIGYFILEKMDFAGKIMLASGRLSSEIVLKCIRSGIPVLVSRAAPTSLAVELAQDANLTIVGFMRGDRMNVYSGKERITT